MGLKNSWKEFLSFKLIKKNTGLMLNIYYRIFFCFVIKNLSFRRNSFFEKAQEMEEAKNKHEHY